MLCKMAGVEGEAGKALVGNVEAAVTWHKGRTQEFKDSATPGETIAGLEDIRARVLYLAGCLVDVETEVMLRDMAITLDARVRELEPHRKPGNIHARTPLNGTVTFLHAALASAATRMTAKETEDFILAALEVAGIRYPEKPDQLRALLFPSQGHDLPF